MAGKGCGLSGVGVNSGAPGERRGERPQAWPGAVESVASAAGGLFPEIDQKEGLPEDWLRAQAKIVETSTAAANRDCRLILNGKILIIHYRLQEFYHIEADHKLEDIYRHRRILVSGRQSVLQQGAARSIISETLEVNRCLVNDLYLPIGEAMIKLKRIYQPPDHADGYRVLVERLWPRGMSKPRAQVDLLLKEIAPSPELRAWYSHDPTKWIEFQGLYRMSSSRILPWSSFGWYCKTTRQSHLFLLLAIWNKAAPGC